MKSTRTPDRVHVVKPPENNNENDSHAPSTGQTMEIIRMLAKIGDKLKRSEAERYELLAELREYRKSLRDLEDKADDSEKAYLSVENKINSSGAMDGEVSQRQIRFEKTLRATEEKMLKSVANQAVIDKRLQDTENKQTMIDERLDESLREQAKLNRKVDVSLQDKARLLRKMERLEEIVMETQSAIAMRPQVVIEDQSVEKKHEVSLSAPVWSDNIKREVEAQDKQETLMNKSINQDKKNIVSKFLTVQNISTMAIVAAALLLGWSISQMIDTDKSSVEEAPIEASNAALNRPQGFDSNALPKMNIENKVTPESAPQATPVMNPVLNYSDEDLLNALNNDPESLATQLNALEPGANKNTPSQAIVTAPVTKQPAIASPSVSSTLENFEEVAYTQENVLAQKIAAEKGSLGLTDRIQADTTLPANIKPLENQAFAGNAEAQHDLAAIYTAGYAGVGQDFDKAAAWLREAADNGVANARYNLGVLNHQGLGRERDLPRALYWYKEAAKLGHAEAQYNLGIAYIEGIGTQNNTPLAAAFFERAANNGIVEAAYNLGLIHDNGLLGEAKADEAFMWYKVAADQGNNEAKLAMKQLADNLQMSDEDVTSLVNRMQQIYESKNGRRAGANKNTQAKAESFSVDSALIAQVQEYLMLTGAYVGPADGVNGPSTQDSIRSYQAANNIPVDGKVTKPLVENMIGGARARLGSADTNSAL